MSEQELDQVEERWGFRFTPEHRTLLGAGLPTGSRSWPDWRDGDAEDLAERLAWPIDGVLFDVEHNGFWHPEWDPRPAGTQDALEVARTYLAKAPVMMVLLPGLISPLCRISPARQGRALDRTPKAVVSECCTALQQPATFHSGSQRTHRRVHESR
jgi:hypothetical protein